MQYKRVKNPQWKNKLDNIEVTNEERRFKLGQHHKNLSRLESRRYESNKPI